MPRPLRTESERLTKGVGRGKAACALLLGLATAAHAAPDPDEQTRACVAGAGSAGAIAACERAAQERWRGELAVHHRALLDGLRGTARERYAAAQAAWESFLAAEFQLIEQTLGARDPLAGAAMAEGAKSELLRQRAEQLGVHVDTIRGRPGD